MLYNFEHLLGILGVLWSSKVVYGRFCEGGHICSLPRECCTQGCCPPYQSGPRQLPPASDHVLNLFFISHWYFWCVVVAIILAILCAYSLWKKRRTVCGWGLSDHHAQSEGDSAGSCYAPPQYSRCNSFHHPPPPYTEVTSKPDLYPLVFTCNSDNGKNGASYLMVQYFRNYIVRPAGSLSATSTVDSLSSSFICNANEANTLVPPPYSRATSPDVGAFNAQFQQHYIPRSASQLVCANGHQDGNLGGNIASQQAYQSRNNQYNSPGSASGGAQGPIDATASTNYNNTQRGLSAADGDSAISFTNGPLSQDGVGALEVNADEMTHHSGGFVQSHSDQYFRYVANSNSSISDIFVNKSCAGELSDRATGTTGAAGYNEQATSPGQQTGSRASSGTAVTYSKGCIQTNPLVHRAVSGPKQLMDVSTNAVYNSNSSIGGISITVPVADDGGEDRDLNVLRRSLETCCQFLQQHQIPMTATYANGDSPLRMHDFGKKYGNEGLRSYVTSGTCSAVSSLANIGTPSSPPQATSPTGEIKDILDQIRQLHATGEANLEENPAMSRAPIAAAAASSLSHTGISEPFSKDGQLQQLTRLPAMPEQHHSAMSNVSPTNVNSKRLTHNSSAASSASMTSNTQLLIAKRPSTLHQNKKKFFTPKPNKALYVPIIPTTSSSTSSNRFPLKSPVSSVVGPNFFANRSRVRKGWISRSAPSTPATGLPPNRLGDDSPLLNEHDEDQEAEHDLE